MPTQDTMTVSVPPSLADVEVTDVELGQAHESIDVGQPGGVYLRVCAPDLVVGVDEMRRLLDRIEEAVLDARHDAMMAARHVCPGCPTLIDPDEPTCGAPACNAELAMDCAGL